MVPAWLSGRHVLALAVICTLAWLAQSDSFGLAPQAAQDRNSTRREFSITSREYAFEPARLEVRQDDIVKISFRATDVAHSFTIDAYRIAKRADAGETIVFEFHASQAGTFPIYCNLAADDRCRDMRAELVVRAK